MFFIQIIHFIAAEFENILTETMSCLCPIGTSSAHDVPLIPKRWKLWTHDDVV